MWLPGSSQGESIAKSTWILGAGPFERGSFYEQTQVAGAPIVVPEIQAIPVETQLLSRLQETIRDKPLARVPFGWRQEPSVLTDSPEPSLGQIQLVSAEEELPVESTAEKITTDEVATESVEDVAEDAVAKDAVAKDAVAENVEKEPQVEETSSDQAPAELPPIVSLEAYESGT